jgi:hypothetical protein
MDGANAKLGGAFITMSPIDVVPHEGGFVGSGVANFLDYGNEIRGRYRYSPDVLISLLIPVLR